MFLVIVLTADVILLLRQTDKSHFISKDPFTRHGTVPVP